MRQPELQGVFESLGDVEYVLGCLGDGELVAASQEFAEVAAFDELHRDVMLAAFAADFVDRNDVLVLESLAEFSFAAKQVHGARVFRPTLPQHLDPNHLAIIN